MVKFRKKYYNEDPEKIKLMISPEEKKKLAGKEKHPGLEWCPDGHMNNLNRTVDKNGDPVERTPGKCPVVDCEYHEVK